MMLTLATCRSNLMLLVSTSVKTDMLREFGGKQHEKRYSLQAGKAGGAMGRNHHRIRHRRPYGGGVTGTARRKASLGSRKALRTGRLYTHFSSPRIRMGCGTALYRQDAGSPLAP